MRSNGSDALVARIAELEEEARERARVEAELLEQQELLRQQNIKLIRKSLDLSDIKRDLEDKNLELETIRSELKRQNINLIRKSIELSDVMRELEDRSYDIRRSKENLESTLAALEESRERFRSLTESTSDWVWEVDNRWVYIYSSPKVEDLLGYEPDEVLGKTPFEFMEEKEAERVSSRFNELAERTAPLERIENATVHKNGWLVVLERSGVPIIGPAGELFGYRGIDRDITEEKAIQRQLIQAKKMEAIGQLAGGVAHDFNNLLTPILGYVDLILMDTDRDDPNFEDLDQIKKAALRGQDLTRQILAFSRRQVLEMKIISLQGVISAFEKTLRRTIREDIELQTDMDSGDDFVKADVSQIEQIIMNLAVNSQDAMPQGGSIRMRVTKRPLDLSLIDEHSEGELGDYVEFVFSDTGSGMTPEVLKRVFDPFFTTKEKGRGTGLGLATVYGIVKQHGGFIAADSSPGGGTTVRIYFPCVFEDREDSTVEQPDRKTRGVETILVVEDDQMVRDVVCRILRAHGFVVFSAEGADQCLELVGRLETNCDLLLSDVVMPKTNGKELFQRLSSLIPDLKVLYMSGYPEEVIASQGILDDGTNFIRKPLSGQSLIRKIRNVLER